MKKYARFDEDHKRRVEQRKLMRQQQNWQQTNQTNQKHVAPLNHTTSAERPRVYQWGRLVTPNSVQGVAPRAMV